SPLTVAAALRARPRSSATTLRHDRLAESSVARSTRVRASAPRAARGKAPRPRVNQPQSRPRPVADAVTTRPLIAAGHGPVSDEGASLDQKLARHAPRNGARGRAPWRLPACLGLLLGFVAGVLLWLRRRRG